MKKLEVFLFVVSIGLFLAPASMLAQNDPPPRCCPRSPGALVVQDSEESSLIQSEFIVSPTMLRVRGMTRSQYIDQVSNSLFAGTQVTLGVSAKRTLTLGDGDAPSAVDKTVANEEGLVAIRETRHYWLPRYRLNSEELDKLGEVSITDGQVYIKIVFADRTSQDAELFVQPSRWR